MKYSYPNLLGYVNNKKGFSTVTSGGETIMYVLGTRNCSNGKQLVIKTTKSLSGQRAIERQTIVPILPYRLMINDPYVFDYIKTRLYPYYESLSLFNPGITFTSKSITMPSQFNSNSTKFIELNIPRSCLSSFQMHEFEQQKLDSYNKTRVNIKLIEAYDLQASMVAESDGLYDNLYLSVSSRVNIDLNYYDAKEASSGFWFWTIPIVIKLRILRSNINSGTVKEFESLPIAWSYPMDLNWFSETQAPTTISKINTAISGGPTVNLWNYNVLPGQYNSTSTRKDYRYAAKSFGCVTDIDYIGANNIICFSSVGNYLPGQKEYKQVHIVSDITLTTGFTLPTTTNAKVWTDNLVTNNTIYKIGNYYAAIANEYTQLNNGVLLNLYDSSLNLVIQRKFGGTAVNGDLTEKDGTLYLLFYTDTKRYIFKFPTIDASFINFIGNGTINVVGMINIFRNSGMTQINEVNSPSLFRRLVNYSITKPDGSNLVCSVDLEGADKSIYFDLKSSFTGNFRALKILSTTALCIDEIRTYGLGQTNNNTFITV